jgi:hypothetical protein
MDSPAAASAPPAPVARPGARWLAAVPSLLAGLVACAALLDRARASGHLTASLLGVGGALAAWHGLLWLARGRAALRVEAVPPVRQHFVQACVQTCLYVYWGWWWVEDGVRPIFAQAPLILIQFAYLYAFEALFAWTRGRTWRVTTGPVPIVLSTNLFIWFRDDWFVWQFAMITAGLLGKEFVKWTRDGRRTHVFNPSGFGLACAATVLIATGTTDLTWAKPLATTLEVPGIYLFVFAIGLVVQHFFRVTLMTFAAVLVMVAINVAYTHATGVYLFASSNLPAAAFLGLHLLMTDPSTSPRSYLGRAVFGACYGLGYVVMFELLGAIGAPELYAKLYPVPILNCTVRALDRQARGGGWFGRVAQRWENARLPVSTNHVHMAAWSAVFAVLVGTGYLPAPWHDEPHPGSGIAFWKQAVAERRHDAERKLVLVAGSQATAGQSAEAYNELGILSLTGALDAASDNTRHKSAAAWFHEAATRGSPHAVENIVAHFLFAGVRRSDDELERALRVLEQRARRPDGARAAFLLGLAYETGGGRPENRGTALELYRRAGDDPFAQKGIVRIGLAPGAVVDLAPYAAPLRARAEAGDGEASFYLSHVHEQGRGVRRDPARARELLARAAALRFAPAIDAKAAANGDALPPFVAPRRRELQQPPWSTAFPVDVR